jgi:uncharacterized protein YdaU (DUF1376 family)
VFWNPATEEVMSLGKSEALTPAAGFFLRDLLGQKMHYYQFNIGDYASHTRHLDLLEDLAYRRLLDLYYLHERPLSVDATIVAKQIGMRDHAALVRDVLNEFFELCDEGYKSARADREIEHFRSKIAQASRAGKASAERRSNARSTDVQPTNNQEPITNNQIDTPRKRGSVVKPVDISESTWDGFLAVRKAKKAPLTEAALDGIRREAAAAGWSLEDALAECNLRGWQGFKAGWVERKVTVPDKDPAVVQMEEHRTKAVPMPDDIRAKLLNAVRKI